MILRRIVRAAMASSAQLSSYQIHTGKCANQQKEREGVIDDSLMCLEPHRPQVTHAKDSFFPCYGKLDSESARGGAGLTRESEHWNPQIQVMGGSFLEFPGIWIDCP